MIDHERPDRIAGNETFLVFRNPSFFSMRKDGIILRGGSYHEPIF